MVTFQRVVDLIVSVITYCWNTFTAFDMGNGLTAGALILASAFMAIALSKLIPSPGRSFLNL